MGNRRPEEMAHFVQAAKKVAESARSLGLDVPAFKTPPSLPDANRSICRHPAGDCVVAVRVHGRSQSEVTDDLVDGVIACNAIPSAESDKTRSVLADAAKAV